MPSRRCRECRSRERQQPLDEHDLDGPQQRRGEDHQLTGADGDGAEPASTAWPAISNAIAA